MTRQSWTAVVSASLFVLVAVLLSVVPVPFVTWSPGITVNLLGKNQAGQPNVTVANVKTYPTSGTLLMTTVSVTRVDSTMSLPEAMLSYVLPNHDVLPREAVYPPSLSTNKVQAQEVALMDSSQQNALVAALRAAGQPVTARPMVQGVSVGGPSGGKLEPGDLFIKVDGKAVTTSQEVGALLTAHKVGDTVVFEVLRQRKTVQVSVQLAKSSDGKDTPKAGIELSMGYDVSASASYGIDSKIVGPSAGLMFSLAIYDEITDNDMAAGQVVAGTGTIDAEGNVGPIGGIREKIAGAAKAHAGVFLVPAGNCADVAGFSSPVNLIKVTTLSDAVSSIASLRSADSAKDVPRC